MKLTHFIQLLLTCFSISYSSNAQIGNCEILEIILNDSAVKEHLYIEKTKNKPVVLYNYDNSFPLCDFVNLINGEKIEIIHDNERYHFIDIIGYKITIRSRQEKNIILITLYSPSISAYAKLGFKKRGMFSRFKSDRNNYIIVNRELSHVIDRLWEPE